MLPAPTLLAEVLPTERLRRSGRLRPALRAPWREIPNLRNAGTILVAYLQWVGVLAIAAIVDHVVVWIVAFVLMVRVFGLLGVLGHEAVHGLLFTNRRVNRGVGRWLLAYPILLPFDWYRQAHLSHHREELGPDDADLGVYEGCPMDRGSFCRKIVRDLCLISGWKVLRFTMRGIRKSHSEARRILVVQGLILFAFGVAGHPAWYLTMWLLPWMTLWRVVTRLRLMAEHGGLVSSKDRRLTTHHVRQRFVSRFFMVPYNLGWHLAHHVDMGIPFRKLPALHRELVASGWFAPGLEHRSYVALWRAATTPTSEET